MFNKLVLLALSVAFVAGVTSCGSGEDNDAVSDSSVPTSELMPTDTFGGETPVPVAVEDETVVMVLNATGGCELTLDCISYTVRHDGTITQGIRFVDASTETSTVFNASPELMGLIENTNWSERFETAVFLDTDDGWETEFSVEGLFLKFNSGNTPIVRDMILEEASLI